MTVVPMRRTDASDRPIRRTDASDRAG